MKNMPTLFILVAATLWGSMGILVRELNSIGLKSMEIVAVRSGVTAICIFVGVSIFKREAFRIKLKDIWCFIGTGICSIVFFNFCYFKTISLTSLSVAVVLLYTAPSMVMILSAILFKEKITIKKITSIIVTFIGCILVTGGLSNNSLLSVGGIMTGLGAGLGYALYSIFSKYAIKKGYSSITLIIWTFIFATIGVLPFVQINKIMISFSENTSVIFPTIILISLTTIVPYTLYILGLRKIEAGKVAVTASVEPVVATCIGVLFYKETIGFTGVLGIVMVILSIVILNTNLVRKQNVELVKDSISI